MHFLSLECLAVSSDTLVQAVVKGSTRLAYLFALVPRVRVEVAPITLKCLPECYGPVRNLGRVRMVGEGVIRLASRRCDQGSCVNAAITNVVEVSDRHIFTVVIPYRL